MIDRVGGPVAAAVDAQLRDRPVAGDDEIPAGPGGGATVTRRHEVEIPIRWSDMDAYGHVNNARTLTLLEEARVSWLFLHAESLGLQRLASGIVVAALDIRYRRPIDYRDRLVVSMGVQDLRASSFGIDYQVTVPASPERDRLVVTASTTMVPVDPDTFRARRLDPHERAWLEMYRA
jgi:acyl-CoA thioester hydrolase